MEMAPNVVTEPEHTVPGSILLLSYLSLYSDRKELDTLTTLNSGKPPKHWDKAQASLVMMKSTGP